MKVSDIYTGRYLKAADVSRPRLLTINKTAVETMEGDGSRKLVAYFKRAIKALVLNKTNSGTVADLYGDDTDLWYGKQLVLFATTCDYSGKRVDCLRVRAPKQSAAPAAVEEVAVAAVEEDECPF